MKANKILEEALKAQKIAQEQYSKMMELGKKAQELLPKEITDSEDFKKIIKDAQSGVVNEDLYSKIREKYGDIK